MPLVPLSCLSRLVFRHSHRRAQSTCKFWAELLRRSGESNPAAAAIWDAAWLTVPVRNDHGTIILTAEHALRRAPAGERIMLAAGTVLHGQIMVAQHLHVRCEEGVKAQGTLILHGGELTNTTLPGQILRAQTKESQTSQQTRRGETVGGVLENLTFSHYNDEAIIINSGGTWTLEHVTVLSSRRGKRSVTAMRVREGGSLRLVQCTVGDASSAVLLERAPCSLRASDCTFYNIKEAINTRGGGRVEIEASSFEQTDVALNVDDLTTGAVTRCHFGEASSVFGNWLRPKAFRLRDNLYTTAEAQEEAEEAEAAAAVEAAEEAAAEEAAEAAAAADAVHAAEAAEAEVAAASAPPAGAACASDQSEPGSSSTAAAAACDDAVEVPGGMSESALSDDETGHGDYFQVEKLVACRNSRGMAIDGYKLNMRLYKVRWAGYGPGFDSWEPADGIPKQLIEMFRDKLPGVRVAHLPGQRVPKAGAGAGHSRQQQRLDSRHQQRLAPPRSKASGKLPVRVAGGGASSQMRGGGGRGGTSGSGSGGAGGSGGRAGGGGELAVDLWEALITAAVDATPRNVPRVVARPVTGWDALPIPTPLADPWTGWVGGGAGPSAPPWPTTFPARPNMCGAARALESSFADAEADSA